MSDDTTRKWQQEQELVNLYAQYGDAAVKRMNSMTSAVAWQVGVVSPGFLGLLWNFVSLSAHTRLSPEWFMGIFRTAELLFLASIISAVILYAFIERVAASPKALGADMQIMMLAIGHLRYEGVASDETVELVKQAQQSFEAARMRSVKAIPWMMKPIMIMFPYLAIAGYALMGVLLVFLKW